MAKYRLSGGNNYSEWFFKSVERNLTDPDEWDFPPDQMAWTLGRFNYGMNEVDLNISRQRDASKVPAATMEWHTLGHTAALTVLRTSGDDNRHRESYGTPILEIDSFPPHDYNEFVRLLNHDPRAMAFFMTLVHFGLQEASFSDEAEELEF